MSGMIISCRFSKPFWVFPVAPKIGKPGMQGSGGTMGDPMADPKARRDYVRNLLYGHK